MSAHTPGPWHAYDDTDTPNRRCEVVALGKTICHIYRSVEEEDASNARLIAAAPELLYAAKRALNVLKAQGEMPTNGNVLGALKFAIDKAIGIES